MAIPAIHLAIHITKFRIVLWKKTSTMANCRPLFGCLVALLALTASGASGKARRLNKLNKRSQCNVHLGYLAANRVARGRALLLWTPRPMGHRSHSLGNGHSKRPLHSLPSCLEPCSQTHFSPSRRCTPAAAAAAGTGHARKLLTLRGHLGAAAFAGAYAGATAAAGTATATGAALATGSGVAVSQATAVVSRCRCDLMAAALRWP